MLIGRTDDPQNPRRMAAFEADSPFGCGSRNPSGPTAMCRVKQAGHTHAAEPDQISVAASLAPMGPSTHTLQVHAGMAAAARALRASGRAAAHIAAMSQNAPAPNPP